MGRISAFLTLKSANRLKMPYLRPYLTFFVIEHKISIVLAGFVNFSILGGVQARWAGPPKSSILPIFTKNDFFGAIQHNHIFQWSCGLQIHDFQVFGLKESTGHVLGHLGRTSFVHKNQDKIRFVGLFSVFWLIKMHRI